ncbi:TolB family protein [Streptomyces boninensis]|uniref:TolB family protein n=1 Tax=Streptomyces boninensis TaxID=2039455 RepID=UPI003B226911
MFRTMRGASVGMLAAALAVTLSVTEASAAPLPQTERITLSSTGAQLHQSTSVDELSAGGRYAVFSSEDAQVVPGDTNGTSDVFVRDLRRGTVERVSVASDGAQVNGESRYAQISADGRYVAFMSAATNLTDWPAPPEHARDVYVHDRKTGRTERVSAAPDGGSAGVLENVEMSADGRYIAYDGKGLAYVADRRTGEVKKISDHIPADWYVSGITLSADGSHLAYVQRHPRGGRHELWLADLRTGEQKLVNATPSGEPTNGSPAGVSLSADGSLVSYSSFDEQTVPEAPTYTWELYLFDSRTGKTRWVTHEGKGGLGGGVLSADGGRLAYQTETEAGNNVHVRDLATGRTQLVTRTLAGGPQAEGYAAPVAFTRDGSRVAFFSTAPDLVTGDTNGVGDGFLLRLG